MSRWCWFLTFQSKSSCGNVKVVLIFDFSIKKLMWQCQGGADFLLFNQQVDVAMSRWYWFLTFQSKSWCGNVKVVLIFDFSSNSWCGNVKVVLIFNFSCKKLMWQCQGGADFWLFREKVDVAMSRWCWKLIFQEKVDVAMSKWSWFLTFHGKSWCGNVKVVLKIDFSWKKLMW